MTINTPKPWSPEVQPTAQEFRQWFLACTDDEQLEIAERVIELEETAFRRLVWNPPIGQEWTAEEWRDAMKPDPRLVRVVPRD